MPIKQTIPTNSSDSVQFGNATTPVAAQVTGAEVSTGNGYLAMSTTASGTVTEQVRVTSAGNVGIGTASPNITGYGATNKVVSVQGTSTYGALELSTNAANANGNSLGQLTFANNASGVTNKDSAIIAAIQSGTSATAPGGAMIFYTRGDGTSNAERMRIDSSGNLLFNSGYGSVATAYGCRAWVNFTTSGNTPTIVAQGNVSSITYVSAGRFTINFTTAFPDANYAVTGATNTTGSGSFAIWGGTQTTTKFDTACAANPANCGIAVFR